jgi:uncharacterized membrane protein
MSINPFDIKTMLLAKHAQHVVLIHFPIALFTAAVAFDFLAQWTKDRTMAAVAYFNLLVAAAFTLPVAATGLQRGSGRLRAKKLKGILLMHLVLGFLSILLIWIAFCIHWRARRISQDSLPKFHLPIEAIAVLLVGLTGISVDS